LRRGRASRVADVIAKTKTMGRQPRQLHGPTDRGETDRRAAAQFANAAWHEGTDQELDARALRVQTRFRLSHQDSPSIEIYEERREPDDLIGADGMVEFMMSIHGKDIETLETEPSQPPDTQRMQWPARSARLSRMPSHDGIHGSKRDDKMIAELGRLSARWMKMAKKLGS